MLRYAFPSLPPDCYAVWRAVGAGSNFHLGARGELDGAKLGVCKGAVAERQIHLEGMRGGFPIEAGFFEVGALSAFKGVMLDGGFKCFKRGIGFKGYLVAMVHFYCLLLDGSVLIGSHFGEMAAGKGAKLLSLCLGQIARKVHSR